MLFDGKGVPEGMTTEQVKQLLTRGWMTHDGMWFLQVLQRHGIDAANEANLAAIKAMAPIEVKRVCKALDIQEPASEEGLLKMLAEGINLQIGDFMNFEWEFGPGFLELDMNKCFAHQGMVAMGCADDYLCGIYLRIVEWMRAVGCKVRMEPDDPRCLMQHTGKCQRKILYELPE